MNRLAIFALCWILPSAVVAGVESLQVAEISETGRDGCMHSATAARFGSSGIAEVCITESATEVLLAYRQPGKSAVVFDRQPRNESGLGAYLVTTSRGRQWLLLESQDKSPGSAWVLWDLTSRQRVMYGRSSTIPYVRDLDADGFAELVIFDDLMITPTSRWQDEAFGMPHVYRLGETMESRSLREYPTVVRDFIMQADIAIDAFTAPCAELSPVDRQTDESCKEMAAFAASAIRVRDFAVLFLSGRPPAR